MALSVTVNLADRDDAKWVTDIRDCAGGGVMNGGRFLA